jgi:hypothetical protein
MSEQTANLETEEALDAEYLEASVRALHDEGQGRRECNRQNYSMYVDEF